MNDELPKCKLCGKAPHYHVGPDTWCDTPTCRLYRLSMTVDAWRRLHGPQPEMTGARLGDVLVRAGVIDAAAVEDPDGYDGYRMVNSLAMAARELADDAAQPLPQPPLSADDIEALRNLAADPMLAPCDRDVLDRVLVGATARPTVSPAVIAALREAAAQPEYGSIGIAIRAALAALGEE